MEKQGSPEEKAELQRLIREVVAEFIEENRKIIIQRARAKLRQLQSPSEK